MTRTRQLGGRIAAAALALSLLAALTGAPAAAADPSPANGKLVLVLDSSGSMKEPAGDGGTKIAAAKTALTRVVGRLPESANVGLRVYGATVFKRSQPGACTDTQLVVPIGTGNRGALKTAVARYKPYGETPIAYSLQQAAKDLGSEGQRTIVLVSDGEATCAPDPCTVARDIAAQGIDLKIDVVGFRVGGKARSQLQCIAKVGRGDYYDADSTDDLEAGLDRLSTRAFRPFRISGEAVTGAPQPESAPVLAPGHYHDTFGAGRTAKYYRIKRTMAKSTLRAGLSFRSPAGDDSAQASVKLTTPDGEECGWSYPYALKFGPVEGLASGSASSWSDWNEKCSDGEEMVLAVSVGDRFKDIAGTTFELVVHEEPPVGDTAALPEKAGDPGWKAMNATTPKQVVPGSSFADAPLVQPGTYKTTLMPGEIQLYKVKLDWGQRLQAQTSVPKLSAATVKVWDHLRYMDTYVISPTRGEAYSVFAKGAPGGGGKRDVLDKNGSVHGITMKEIRYDNRNGANNQDHATSIPGEYYLAITLEKDRPDEPAFAIPMNLTIGVYGESGKGAPAYEGEPAGGDPTTTPSDDPSASETPTDSEGNDGTEDEAGGPVESQPADGGDAKPVAAIAALGGGGLLFLLLAAWAILLAKRTRSPR
jgi:Ca-activated chloride channel family protein